MLYIQVTFLLIYQNFPDKKSCKLRINIIIYVPKQYSNFTKIVGLNADKIGRKGLKAK